MKLPIAKPVLIGIIVMIAVVGVSAGLIFGNQSNKNTIQPVPNQSQEPLNDSQMMKNLENQSDSENIKINEVSDVTGDVSNDTVELTATIPTVNAQEIIVDDGTLIKVVKIVKVPYQVKVPYKVKKAYKVQKKYKVKVKYISRGKTKYKYITKYKYVTKYKYITKYRYETRYKNVEQITYETPSTEYDPLEDPGNNPDNNDYDDSGSDSGDDQTENPEI